jgi:transposase
MRHNVSPESTAARASAPLPSESQRVLTETLDDGFNFGFEEQEFVAKLRSLCPELEATRMLAQQFSQMIEKRQTDALRAWLDRAVKSGLLEFQSFAVGLQRDAKAVEAALSYEWSNGQVEG